MGTIISKYAFTEGGIEHRYSIHYNGELYEIWLEQWHNGNLVREDKEHEGSAKYCVDLVIELSKEELEVRE